ncbi:MAG: hypothetical protein KGM16_16950 [Bacteroidota bacterium]|nr:hypothetical protein [Bacteroidota bacterium]
MTDYKKILEEFRTYYRNKYDINFDDEILYFFVRVNEMQKDLKKDIRNLPKVTFKTGWDYFLYGLGKWLTPSLVVTIFLSTLFFRNTMSKQHPQFMIPAKIFMKNNIQYLELKTDSANYYLPIQKK